MITPLFDRARAAAAGDLPDGPFRGVPFVLKDLSAHSAGDPFHEGMAFLKDRGWTEPADTALAARFRAAGLVTVGKTNTPGARHPPHHRAAAPTARPATPGTPPAPPAVRAAGRRRRWPPGSCPIGARQRRRRVDPHPGQRVRAGRPQAHAGARVVGPGVRRRDGRAHVRARGVPVRARHRRRARRRARHGAGRPVRRARPVAALRRGARRRPRRAPHRRDDRQPGRQRRRAPRLRRRGRGGGAACSSRSATGRGVASQGDGRPRLHRALHHLLGGRGGVEPRLLEPPHR